MATDTAMIKKMGKLLSRGRSRSYEQFEQYMQNRPRAECPEQGSQTLADHQGAKTS